jgi:P4 family phage/plasmid primase-like protien
LNIQEDCIGKSVNLMLQATAGNRHLHRLKAARLAGGYIAAGQVEEAVILEALLRASDSIADGNVTSEPERQTLLEGIEDGKKAPIPFDDPNDFGELFLLGGGNSPISYSTQDVRDGTATTHPLTELGNAKRLRDGHGKNSKFIIGTDIFIHWADCKWLIDKDGAGMRNNAAELPEQIYKEGLAYPEQGLKFANWSRTSQSKQAIVNAVSLYKDFEEVRVSPNSIDANKLAIGVNSAREVIELGTGVYRAATQKDHITKSVNATALGNAFEATRWIKFIDEIFGGDAELVDWVQRWCGYLLSGSTQEQIFVFSYGSGSNGKSVFIEMLKYIMGDYAKAIQPETLANNQRTAGAATPELAALKCVRLVLATETEEGVQLAESLIKSLTGGDTIVARPLYGAPIEYVPQFKIMLTGNHKPQIRGNDDGIWRRVRLLHFTQKFSKANCDPFLLAKLKAESNHILAWLVDGYSKWQKLGLKDTPKSMEKATAQYRSDQDIVGRWIEERCELDCKAESAGSKLYLSYSSWCDENGLKKCSNVILSRRLEDRGLVKRHSRNGAVYAGIAVHYPFNVHGQELPYKK